MIIQHSVILSIDCIQDAEALSASRVRLFRVSIGDVSRLTRLDFGPRAAADMHEATAVGPRVIESIDDIRV